MDQQTRDQLEVCRPGHQDWEDADLAQLAEELRGDPSLRDLAAHLEEIDEAVVAALYDVSPPPGLAARIMARLDACESQAQAVSAAPPTAQVVEMRVSMEGAVVGHEASPATGNMAAKVAAPATAVSSPAVIRSTSRRRWLAVAATAAAALVAATLFWPSGDAAHRVAQIVEAVEQVYNQQLKEHTGWQSGVPAGSHALPRELKARPVAWRNAQLLGAAAVAYDVVAADGRHAVLLEIPARAAGLPTSPPYQPQSSSGRSIAVWKPGGSAVYYVLVVEGTRRDYQSFVELGQNLT